MRMVPLRPPGVSSAGVTAGLNACRFDPSVTRLVDPLATRIGIVRRTEDAFATRGGRLAYSNAGHLYRTLKFWGDEAPLLQAVAHLPETMLPMELVTVLAHLDALPYRLLDYFVHQSGVSSAMFDDSLIASAAYTLRQAFAPAEDDVSSPLPDFAAALKGKRRYIVAAFQPGNMSAPAVRALAAGLGVIAAEAS